ncbi:MAG: hypothetical protein RL701_2549 [Pseudomonadota bacterium]
MQSELILLRRNGCALWLGVFASAWLSACWDGVLAGPASQHDYDHYDDYDAVEPASRVGGRTFYVRASGDDAASGRSLGAGWRSIERANQALFEPGDSLLFEGGATFAGNLRLRVKNAGSARAPVRVSSHGRELATLDAGEGDGIVIADISGVIVERLHVQGGWNSETQTGNAGEGVRVIGTRSGERRHYVRLRDLTVSGFQLAGIGLHAQPSDDAKNSGYQDVEISDCEVHDNGHVGVVSDGPYIYDGPGYSHADVHVLRVRAHHNRGLVSQDDHTGSGIVLSDVDGALIEHSIAHDNGEFNDKASGGGFGIWTWDATHVTIQRNESYDNRSMTADGGGFDLDGGVTQSVLRYNYSHGNHGAGYGAFQFEWARPFHGNRIYSNISQNDGFGMYLWDGNGDMGALDILQNVTYGESSALTTISGFSDVTVLNNVFYALGPVTLDVYAAAGLTLQGNVYWTGERPLAITWESGSASAATYAGFDTYRDSTQQEAFEGAATGSYQDPKLVAAGSGPTLEDTYALSTLTMYQLQSDSPLIDRGVDPELFGVAPVQRDFFEQVAPRGGAFDPGVSERQ